ncbi:MAG: hypothetical protein K6V73_06255 [Firmicutes bacterium]|nr:hypothetical protein [Bacillota bacterium]
MAFVPHPQDADLDFLAALLAPEGREREEVRRRLRQEPDLLAQALDHPDALAHLRPAAEARTVSPWLVFALFLRAARRELGPGTAIPEWTGRREVVPVLDGEVARGALADEHLRRELERVLTAFTRLHPRALAVYERGRLRRLRMSELDPDSLRQALPYAHGEVAADLLRRMADAYLFLAGVYPDHLVDRLGKDLEEWEVRGQGLYRTAAAHYEEGAPEWARDLEKLAASFHAARRALNFVTKRFLARERPTWFVPMERGA